MARDWMYDAVLAEVAYRHDELRKARRLTLPLRTRRQPARAPQIPRQRRGEHDR
ncbi:hypothetical protein [Amycolatopsis suaedae]|uniref:hypothetical protein n=1 Tax=Amycolatopsis suaedae TaxID=2510978 RepID=UPI0013EF3487|nr:hypothetical protein [Amycolatopsis suaedae]